MSLNSDPFITTITNIDGEYSLVANKGDSIIFSFMGFITKKRLIEDAIWNVNLTLDTIWLLNEEKDAKKRSFVVLNGYVIDSLTKQPIDMVRIIRNKDVWIYGSYYFKPLKIEDIGLIGELYGEDKIANFSDKSGSFKTIGNKGVSIEFRHSNYATKEINIDSLSENPIIELVPRRN